MQNLANIILKDIETILIEYKNSRTLGIVQNLANIILKDIETILIEYKNSLTLGEDNYNFLGDVTVILSCLINLFKYYYINFYLKLIVITQ